MTSWILVAVLGVIALAVAAKLLSVTAHLQESNTHAGELERDNKKLKNTLDATRSKYEKKANEASTSGTKRKDQKQRIAQLGDDLQAVRADLAKAEKKAKEASSALNRVRVEREELRLALKDLRGRPARSEPASAPEMEAAPVEPPADAAPAPAAEAAPSAPPEGEDRRGRSLGRMERELADMERERDKAIERVRAMKRRLVQTTADLRLVQRKNEANRRAYIITQLQLDLLTDENYVLQHGHPPPYMASEKSKKRAALSPEPEKIVADPNAVAIQLPGAAEPEPEPEPEVDIAAAEAEVADALAAEEAEVMAEAAAADAGAEAPVAAAEAATPEPVPAAPEPIAATPEPAEERSSTVRLRKAKPADDDVAAAAEIDRPAAPPRPVAPPRPAAPPRPPAK